MSIESRNIRQRASWSEGILTEVEGIAGFWDQTKLGAAFGVNLEQEVPVPTGQVAKMVAERFQMDEGKIAFALQTFSLPVGMQRISI